MRVDQIKNKKEESSTISPINDNNPTNGINEPNHEDSQKQIELKQSNSEIVEMNKRILEKLEAQEKKLEAQEKKLEAQEKKLETQEKKHKEEILELHEEISKLHEEISKLHEEISKLHEENKKLKLVLSEKDDKIEVLSTNLEALSLKFEVYDKIFMCWICRIIADSFVNKYTDGDYLWKPVFNDISIGMKDRIKLIFNTVRWLVKVHPEKKDLEDWIDNKIIETIKSSKADIEFKLSTFIQIDLIKEDFCSLNSYFEPKKIDEIESNCMKIIERGNIGLHNDSRNDLVDIFLKQIHLFELKTTEEWTYDTLNFMKKFTKFESLKVIY